jgi:hypothetical protein
MLIILSGTETIRKQHLAQELTLALNGPVGLEETHFKMLFRDIYYDYGATDKITYPEGGNYQQFIAQYKTRSYDKYVISGSFSRAFIEQLEEDVEDLIVLNIVRNPSTTYIMDSMELEDNKSLYDVEFNIPLLKRRYISSILNSITLANMPNVTTLRYEDLIHDGKLSVAGVSVSVVKPYNEWTTAKEKIGLTFYLKITQEDLDRFNATFSRLCFSLQHTNYDLPVTIFDSLPENVFEELGYEQLTLKEIVFND